MQRTYKIAINQIAVIEKPNWDKDLWATYMARFKPQDVTADEFIEKIGRGFSFAPIFGNDGYPRLENFVETPFLVVDMDTEDERSSLRTLAQHPMVGYHGGIIYPTHRHTQDRPRHRVVFLLDQPLRNPDTVVMMQRFLAGAFNGGDPSVNANKTWQANGKIDADDMWGLVHLNSHFRFSPEQVANYVAQYRLKVAALDRKDSKERQQRTYNNAPDEGRMSLHELGQKLGRIDPYSMDYPTWVKFCAAIAHSYGTDAFWLVKDWSDRPDKTPLNMGTYKAMMREHPNAAGYGTILHILKERNL